jgi:hypothetical protein
VPYTSEAQRRFMALVHAVQQGKVDRSKVSKSVLEVADSMTAKQTEDFMKPTEDVRKTSSAEARHTTAIQRLLSLSVRKLAEEEKNTPPPPDPYLLRTYGSMKNGGPLYRLSKDWEAVKGGYLNPVKAWKAYNEARPPLITGTDAAVPPVSAARGLPAWRKAEIAAENIRRTITPEMKAAFRRWASTNGLHQWTTYSWPHLNDMPEEIQAAARYTFERTGEYPRFNTYAAKDLARGVYGGYQGYPEDTGKLVAELLKGKSRARKFAYKDWESFAADPHRAAYGYREYIAERTKQAQELLKTRAERAAKVAAEKAARMQTATDAASYDTEARQMYDRMRERYGIVSNPGRSSFQGPMLPSVPTSRLAAATGGLMSGAAIAQTGWDIGRGAQNPDEVASRQRAASTRPSTLGQLASNMAQHMSPANIGAAAQMSGSTLSNLYQAARNNLASAKGRIRK